MTCVVVSVALAASLLALVWLISGLNGLDRRG